MRKQYENEWPSIDYKITFVILLWTLYLFTVVYWDNILLLINLFLLKTILTK